MSDKTSERCPCCQSELVEQARFCARCGRNLHGLAWQKKTVILLVALLVWFGTDLMARSLAGPKPPDDASLESARAEIDYNDPVLQRLRDNAKSAPQSAEAWRALSDALRERIASNEKAPPAIIFEAIDAVAQQIKINPQDSEALRVMADLSFEQQAFGKAVEFYAKYMELNPQDLHTRAKYASSLSFVGRFEEAVSQLKEVLKVEPDHFHALAYLSITYAQMGQKDNALSYGKQALALAPSAEAQQRFQKFLNTIDDSKAAALPSSSSSPEQRIIDSVKNNPVAGPKFLRSELDQNGALKLYFKDFPMQGMPPFAKEKFLGPLKTLLLEQINSPQAAKQILFVDAANGTVMETLE